MGNKHIKHGFTAVDAQPDPRFWVDVLDKAHRDPFVIAYKKRVLELLDPQPGRLYLDVGAGTGEDARAVAIAIGTSVTAVDSSRTMMAEAMKRGLPTVAVGHADALPFAIHSFHGCWADRTFQHLLHPDRALDEIVRVTRPGGRIVIVDPDYDTQVMEFPDQKLARRVFRFRAEVGLRNGSIAHRMPGMFATRGLRDIRVETMTRIVRDPTAADNVMGLKTWARSAMKIGWFTEEEVVRWETLYDEVADSGRFLWSVTFFISTAVKPA
jgi:SAM-dependent methyltransferase